MKQMIRELKRQVAGEKLEPEQLKGLIRAGYVYRNGEEPSSLAWGTLPSLSQGCTPAGAVARTEAAAGRRCRPVLPSWSDCRSRSFQIRRGCFGTFIYLSTA